MESTLNVGDNINIPENCEVVIEDNILTVKEKQKKFKDEDILVVTNNPSFVVIFKEYSLNRRTFCSYFNNQELSDTNWSVKCFRHATEEEKQAFFDELKAKGLRWNAETKAMEKFRRRAEKGKKYLYIGSLLNIEEATETYDEYDDGNFKFGNYYLLEERAQAEEDAKEIKAVFDRRVRI